MAPSLLVFQPVSLLIIIIVCLPTSTGNTSDSSTIHPSKPAKVCFSQNRGARYVDLQKGFPEGTKPVEGGGYFYFGHGLTANQCEDRCMKKHRCYAYTFVGRKAGGRFGSGCYGVDRHHMSFSEARRSYTSGKITPCQDEKVIEPEKRVAKCNFQWMEGQERRIDRTGYSIVDTDVYNCLRKCILRDECRMFDYLNSSRRCYIFMDNDERNVREERGSALYVKPKKGQCYGDLPSGYCEYKGTCHCYHGFQGPSCDPVDDDLLWKNHAGRFYRIVAKRVQHSEAVRECEALGANLANLDTEEEKEYVVKEVRATLASVDTEEEKKYVEKEVGATLASLHTEEDKKHAVKKVRSIRRRRRIGARRRRIGPRRRRKKSRDRSTFWIGSYYDFGNTTAKCLLVDSDKGIIKSKKCSFSAYTLCEKGGGSMENQTVVGCIGGPPVTPACEKGAIKILSVNYGRTKSNICTEGASEQETKNTACLSGDDALYEVEKLCQDNPSCSLSIPDLALGDPCPGTKKYLEVSYKCVL